MASKDNKIKLALIACFSLVLSALALPASASPIQVVEVSQTSWQAAWQTKLHWSASAETAATKAIEVEAKRLQNTYEYLSQRDAVSVKVIWHLVSQSSIGMARTIPGLRLRSFELVGLGYDGRELARSSLFPKDAKNLAAYEVKPNHSKCAIDAFNLFDVTTWFSTKCDVSRPTPAQFLRDSLAAKVSFASANDLALFEVARLNTILANNYEFTIRDNKLYCPQLAEPITLVSNARLGGYRIVRMSSGGFKLLLQGPNLAALARTASLGDDGTYIRFG